MAINHYSIGNGNGVMANNENNAMVAMPMSIIQWLMAAIWQLINVWRNGGSWLINGQPIMKISMAVAKCLAGLQYFNRQWLRLAVVIVAKKPI